VNPRFYPLGTAGGALPILALEPDSPAIGTGSVALAVDASGQALAYDQRGVGFSRTQNGSVDIGAYQILIQNLVVSTTSDENDGNYSFGHLSLREAIELADQNPSGINTITFDPGVFAAPQLIMLTDGPLPVITATNLTITASNEGVTINGNGQSYVLQDGTSTASTLPVLPRFLGETVPVNTFPLGSALTLSGLTIVGANAGSGTGGGVLAYGMLDLTDCTVANNLSTHGGDVAVFGTGTATLSGCTFTGNTLGAGLLLDAASATVNNCIFSGNADGLSSQGSLTLTNSTIVDNQGTGAIVFYNSDLTNNTISSNSGIGLQIGMENDLGILASSVTVTDCSLSNNGGAGCLTTFLPSCDITFTNCTQARSMSRIAR
jgi:hypothetical protein